MTSLKIETLSRDLMRLGATHHTMYSTPSVPFELSVKQKRLGLRSILTMVSNKLLHSIALLVPFPTVCGSRGPRATKGQVLARENVQIGCKSTEHPLCIHPVADNDGGGSEGRRGPILISEQRVAVYNELLTKLKNGHPEKGAFSIFSEQFHVHPKTISRIWKQARQSVAAQRQSAEERRCAGPTFVKISLRSLD